MAPGIDSAVRSIRIAANLNERFGMILRTPLTQTEGMSGLELRIGEAQQIYPEIWTHLDEARATLAGRGVSTAGYDTVRALEPKGSMGVTRVDLHGYSTSLTTELLGIQDEYVKSANFNVEGHRRANMAVRALMDAMPEVDWKGVERAENAEIIAAGSLGPINPRSALTWLVIGGGGLLVTYAFWYLVIRTPPVDHVARRKAHIAELRARLDAAPCDKSTIGYLTNEEAWDEPPPADRYATAVHYDGLCQTIVSKLEAELDVAPCDAKKQAALVALVTARTGNPRGARKAAGRYRDKCGGSTATVPP
jgi:hypothetical protein